MHKCVWFFFCLPNIVCYSKHFINLSNAHHFHQFQQFFVFFFANNKLINNYLTIGKIFLFTDSGLAQSNFAFHHSHHLIHLKSNLNQIKSIKLAWSSKRKSFINACNTKSYIAIKNSICHNNYAQICSHFSWMRLA